MIVTYSGANLRIGTDLHVLRYPIQDAFNLGNVVVVLYDPDAVPAGPFRNLVALTEDGSLVWEAETPTGYPTDRYYRIASHSPLIAYSSQSFDCCIDPTTGRIISRTFTK